MNEILGRTVQTGFGDAARWLKLFNAAYSAKLGMPVFPGSLNIALDHVFDWFDPSYEAHRFGSAEKIRRRARHTAAFLRTSESRSSKGFLVDADDCGKRSTGSVGRRDCR